MLPMSLQNSLSLHSAQLRRKSGALHGKIVRQLLSVIRNIKLTAPLPLGFCRKK